MNYLQTFATTHLSLCQDKHLANNQYCCQMLSDLFFCLTDASFPDFSTALFLLSKGLWPNS